MNTSWPVVRLSDAIRLVPRAERIDPSKEYSFLGVRLDGAGPFLRETKRGAQIRATTVYRVVAGDFIYSRLFAWRGAFGVIPPKLDGCYVSNEFPTFEPIADRIDVQFLSLWFRLPSILARVEEQCTGSTPLTRNRFSQDAFLAMEFPLPPLDEQRRIVARIEELAGRIEEMKLLQSAVGKVIPNLISSVHLMYAQNRIVALGDILELDERKEPVQFGREYPQIGIRSFGEGLFIRQAVDAAQTTYASFNILYEGAVVLSQVKGWEGAVAVCPSQFAGVYASPEYRTFRCIDRQACPDYLSAVFATSWFWSQLSILTRGVGARRERTRPEHFLAFKIPMPVLDQQQLLVPLLKKLGRMERIRRDSQVDIGTLLPAILNRAFSGGL